MELNKRKIEDGPLSTCLKLLDFFDDLWHHCEEIAYNPDVCNLKYRSIRVLVDGYDDLRRTHAYRIFSLETTRATGIHRQT